MANYTFVSNARFRPFSYQEMLQPIQAYTEEYNTIQESIGELGTKADVFSKLANEQTDPKAYAMYKGYSDSLMQQAEALSKGGLTPASRQGLIDLRRRFSSEIVPIEQAYTRRQALIEAERKALEKDPTLILQKSASTISLDDLIDNPAFLPKFYSGELLAKQVGSAVQNLSREMRTNPKWESTLQNQYFAAKLRKGYSPAEVLLSAMDDPRAPKELKDIVNNAVASSGIPEWGDNEALRIAYQHAKRGLWEAVGGMDYKTLANRTPAPSSGGSGGSGDYELLDLPTVNVGALISDSKDTLTEKDLEGLVYTKGPDGKGSYENNYTRELAAKIESLNEDISKAEKYSKQNYSGSVGLGNLAAGQGQQGSRLGSLQRQKEDAIKELESYKERLSGVRKNYKLSPNAEENLKLATALETQQSMEQISASPVIYQDGRHKDILEGIRTSYKLIPEKDNLGAYKFNGYKKGKRMDIDDTIDFLNREDVTLGIVPGKGYIATSDKGTILLSGLPDLDKINEISENTQAYLRNFKGRTPVNYSEVTSLDNPDAQEILRYAYKKGTNLKNGYYGLTIQDPRNRDIINIVVRRGEDGQPEIYQSSMLDEIMSRGSMRGRDTRSQLLRSLNHYATLYSGVRAPGKTLPSKKSYLIAQ